MVRRLLTGVFVTLVAMLCVTAFVHGQQGRWKIQGDQCLFDPDDDGFDQCSPTAGRWKISGDSCIFDPNDSGPNQCPPPVE
jgi:hypothetical protein